MLELVSLIQSGTSEFEICVCVFPQWDFEVDDEGLFSVLVFEIAHEVGSLSGRARVAILKEACHALKW
jgi:hypothetical protein